MEILGQVVDIFLHLDVYLNAMAASMGPWLYVLLFAVIFCETGLVVTPFLPGDSLIFAVGALAAAEGSAIKLPYAIIILILDIKHKKSFAAFRREAPVYLKHYGCYTAASMGVILFAAKHE